MDQERTYKWIQDKIRELHSGTLSDGDRSRLEEIAKNDPFVQDALEGYVSTTHHDHSRQLRTLSHRITNLHTAKRRRLFPSRNQLILQAVAASLLLILVTWAVFYYVSKENNTVVVAADIDQTSPSTPAPVISIESEEPEENSIAIGETHTELEQGTPGLRADAESKAKEYLNQKENVTSPSTASREAFSSNDAIREEAPTLTESSTTQSPPPSEVQDDNSRIALDEDVASPQTIVKNDEGLYANQMHPAMMASRVTGQVMDQFGQPVTGAQLSITETNLMTITDLYGQFELFLPEKLSRVEIYSSGYKDTTVNMTQGKENYIVMLLPATDGYSTYSTTGRETQAGKTRAYNPGQNTSINYLAYLTTSSKFPIQSDYSLSAKQVTLQFSITEAGRPEQTRIKKSNAGKAYEAEAIRLVENGPDWACDARYPCNKEYTIFFK